MHPFRPTARRRFTLVALLITVALLVGACGDDDDGDSDAAPPGGADARSGPAVVLGAQDFTESRVLSEVYAQALSAAGYQTRVQDLGGYRDLLYGAIATGDVNFAVEYVGSLLNFLSRPEQPAGNEVEANVAAVTPLLEGRDVAIAQPSDAVNTNAFVMTRQRSDELGITTLSELAEKGASLRIGAPSDCETNAFCLPGLQRVYGLDLSSNLVALDEGRHQALAQGVFDVAVLFSTDPPIAEGDLVVLEDDQGMLPADNIVPVLSDALVEAFGQELVDQVDRVSARLDTEVVAEMNRAYESERRELADIAREFLEDNDLG